MNSRHWQETLPAMNVNTKEPIDWQLRYAWMLEKKRTKHALEHYIVKWSIENINLLPENDFKNVVFVSSPSFSFSSSQTVWRFTLLSNKLCNNLSKVAFCIQRLPGRGPPKVHVKHRFGVEDVCNKIIWFDRCSKVFKSGDTDEFQDLTSEYFSANDALVLNCEMYLAYPFVENFDNLLTKADYDLINLSADVVKLLESTETFDFCMTVGGSEINGHKAILGARSLFFNKLFKSERDCTRYEVSDQSLSNVLNFMCFVYSGNFNMVAENGSPDIGFYECAVQYGVPDLVTLLTPNHMNLRSKLQGEEIEFTWHIEDVSKRFTGVVNCMRSPVFKCPYDGSPEFSLILFSKRMNTDSYNLDIHIESSASIVALHSVFKISLKDDDGNPSWTTTIKPFKTNAKVGCKDFAKDLSIHNGKCIFLAGDTLTVHCQWTFVVSRDFFDEHVITQRSSVDMISSYSRLSQDLQRLYVSGEFSDVTIKSNSSPLRAHKAVLFARSRRLASALCQGSDASRDFEITDIDPAVLSIMIKHAYCGILGDLSPVVLVKLLCASEKYGFANLSLMCGQLLGPIIDGGNFFEILEMGRKLNNVTLVGKCLTFAKENAVNVLADAVWEKRKRQARGTYELLETWLPTFAQM